MSQRFMRTSRKTFSSERAGDQPELVRSSEQIAPPAVT